MRHSLVTRPPDPAMPPAPGPQQPPAAGRLHSAPPGLGPGVGAAAVSSHPLPQSGGGVSPSGSFTAGDVEALQGVWEQIRAESAAGGGPSGGTAIAGAGASAAARPAPAVTFADMAGPEAAGGARAGRPRPRDSSSSSSSDTEQGGGADVGGASPRVSPPGLSSASPSPERDALTPLLSERRRARIACGAVAEASASAAGRAGGDASTCHERGALPRLSLDGTPGGDADAAGSGRRVSRFAAAAARRCDVCGGWACGSGGGAATAGPAAAAAREPHSWDPEHLIVNGSGGAFLHPTHVFRLRSCARGGLGRFKGTWAGLHSGDLPVTLQAPATSLPGARESLVPHPKPFRTLRSAATPALPAYQTMQLRRQRPSTPPQRRAATAAAAAGGLPGRAYCACLACKTRLAFAPARPPVKPPSLPYASHPRPCPLLPPPQRPRLPCCARRPAVRPRRPGGRPRWLALPLLPHRGLLC
jgi:hypothetical protein